jgi:phage terminase Nu1 subunit (DNA packaging protein)
LAELRELEVGEKRAALLQADDVAREWDGVLRNVRSAVLAVVSRVRAQLPALDARTVEVLDREIRAALAALGEPPQDESEA